MLEPVALLLLSVGLGFLPFLAMVITSYTKIAIVLSLLRNAMGVQQVPPNMVLNGVAVILSLYILAPVGDAATHSLEGSDSRSGVERILEASNAARVPFQKFLVKHTQPQNIDFFMATARDLWPAEQAERLDRDDLIVLAPAFLISELTDAFRIGFLLYLVFVIIDLVVASTLLAMGLSQVNPGNVSIPFKLLLFIMLDGWTRLLQGLIQGYR